MKQRASGNYKKSSILIYVILFILSFSSLYFIRKEIAVGIIYCTILIYLILSKDKMNLINFAIATFVSIIWILIANDEYGYNRKTILIFGYNSFPFFAWAAGLFASYLFYSAIEKRIKSNDILKKTLLYLAIFWPSLIFSEAVGYHYFGIHNIQTAEYRGIPILDCIHAPLWMQISYFLLGPIYYTLCELKEYLRKTIRL